jgi:arylsulfatase A-like enzyme
VSTFYDYNRGFEYFNDFLLGQVEDDVKKNSLRKKFHEGVKGIKALLFHQLPHETGEQINETVFQWLNSIDSSFFAWIHYMDVHMPYVPPNRYLRELGIQSYSHMKKVWMGKKIDDANMRDEIRNEEIQDYINLYDGTIRYIDTILKDLIRKIEEKFPNTIFIITADHGEEFREHHGLSHLEKLYDELLHVPLFIYGNNVEATVVEKPVSLIDLAPTILQLLGLPEEESFQGVPLTEHNGFVLSEALGTARLTSYRDLYWKMILSKDKRELYYLPDDPLEKNNVYSDYKKDERIQKMEKQLQQHLVNILCEREKRQTSIQKRKIQRAAQRLKKR